METEQLQGHFNTGIVTEVEGVPPYRVKVQFPDMDNIISPWLHVLVPKIQDDKYFWQPDVGEQVAVLMDEHDEEGCVVGSVPSNADQAPEGLTPDDTYIGFSDGTEIKYNRETHELIISLCGGGKFTLTQSAGGSIGLDENGNATIQGASTVSFSLGGAAASDALALVSLLIAAFNAHVHGSSPTPNTPWTAETIASTLVKTSN